MARSTTIQETGAPQWAIDIAEARKQRGMTQTELAEKLRISQSTVTDWERGKAKPRSPYWLAIKGALGVDLSETLGEDYKLRPQRGGQIRQRAFHEMSQWQQTLIFLRRLEKAYEDAKMEVSHTHFTMAAWKIRRRIGLYTPANLVEARLYELIEEQIESELHDPVLPENG